MKIREQIVVATTFAALALCSWSRAQPTPLDMTFSYQGVLKSGGTPANGTYHLRFQLWDALSGGAQIGADVDHASLNLTDGLFTATLDFGAVAFDGSARWLQVQVVTNGGNTVTTLAPRQPVTATPYAVFAMKADGPNLINLNASNLASGTVPGAQLAGTYANALSLSNAANAFTGAFSGSGAGLTLLNAANISTGALAAARLPTSGTWAVSALAVNAATDITLAGSTLHLTSSAITLSSVPQMPTTTRAVTVNPAEFVPFSSGVQYIRSDAAVWGQTVAQAVQFQAPLQLPDGAIITAVTFLMLDNDATQTATCSLIKNTTMVGGVLPGAVTLGTGTTTGASTLIAGVAISGLPHTVNNATGSYLLKAAWAVPASGLNMMLLGAKVTYTIAAPLP